MIRLARADTPAGRTTVLAIRIDRTKNGQTGIYIAAIIPLWTIYALALFALIGWSAAYLVTP